MKSAHSTGIAALVIVAASALPGAATAQSTWNLVSGCTNPNAGSYGNTSACTAVGSGPSVTVSAYSSQPGTGATLQTVAGGYYANAYLGLYSGGFGVSNRTEGASASGPDKVPEPQHAIDNSPTGAWDGVLLDFGGTQRLLSSIGIGYGVNPSGTTFPQVPVDVTILEWTGSGSPVAGTGSSKSLAGSGWSLVGSYKDVASSDAPRATGATIASSWWLITAFNSALNGGTSCKTATGTGACDEGDDAFKLNYISTAAGGTSVSVPEPASLALVAVALLGATTAGRRRSSGKA